MSRSWIDREDYLAWLDAECTYPFIEPEYRLGSEPSLSHSFGELVGPEKRMVREVYGATSEGDWYDIDSNSIINESHERYGNEKTGWQLAKASPTKRYVHYRTVDEPVNYRFKEDQDKRAKH